MSKPKKPAEPITVDLALKRAHDLAAETKQTACVFTKTTTRAGVEIVDYASGSAYAPPPDGWKPHLFVSVTGLVRVVS